MNTEKDFGTFDSSFKQKKKYVKLKPITFFSIVILLLVLLGVSLFLYTKKDTPIPEAPALSEEETKALIENVSQLMIIPKEEPAILVISDIEELKKQQAFFEDAINGDILFIFAEAAKAVIYSPSRNVIVNTGPVTSDDTQSQADVSSSQSQEVQTQDISPQETITEE